MATITINKKNFEKEIGKLNNQMQEKIAMFGTPLEKISDDEIELEIFPNRPDLLSYHGFKRAFLSWLGKKSETGLKTYKINKPEKNYNVLIDKSVENVRPYTACAIVKNLKFDDEKIKEIINIQEKLHNTVGRKRKKLAIGIYPLEKINLPITYKAKEPDKIKFIPLGMEKELSGLEILQRHPAGRDYSHLLAGKTGFPIFIDANKNILSMPPIINSQTTGKITNETRTVFIECSGFNFEILKKCLNIIVTAIMEMDQKARVYQMELRYPGKFLKTKKEITPDFKSEKIKLSAKNVNKILGLNLKEKQIKKLLEKMGHSYKKGWVSVPAWRTDILHEVDLIEDIAIAYGYKNFIPELPSISTIGSEDEKETTKRKIREILSGLGLIEITNYHLTTKQDQITKMDLNEKTTSFFPVVDSKTEYDILRKDLSHYVMKILSENIDVEYPQKVFEIGTIFNEDSKIKEIKEKDNLCIVLTPGNFTELKQILEYLARMLGTKINFNEPKHGSMPLHFIEGRVGEVFINKKPAGFIGEIHPKILKNWRLKMPVALLEIELNEIFKKF